MSKENETSLDDNTIVLDISGAGAQPALDIISFDNLDTITLSSDYMASGSITSPTITTTSVPSSYQYTGTYQSTWTTGTGYTIGTGINSSPNIVNINNDGIDIKDGGDIKINGSSLKEFMLKMEQRLAILVPDPEKLEKFEALKKAYEHYKTMEALCFPDEKEKKE